MADYGIGRLPIRIPNPQIGILACVKKKYPPRHCEMRMTGIGNKFIASKHTVKLPPKEEVEKLLAERLIE